ncbi:MAG: hypothetical protein GX802_06285 [Clostridiales bacterium]|nr:hypothetical protein [Clostridiales bacterium]
MQKTEGRIKNENSNKRKTRHYPLISKVYVCVGAGIARPPKITYHASYKR